MLKRIFTVMEEEFGITGQAGVMIENVELTEVLCTKTN